MPSRHNNHAPADEASHFLASRSTSADDMVQGILKNPNRGPAGLDLREYQAAANFPLSSQAPPGYISRDISSSSLNNVIQQEKRDQLHSDTVDISLNDHDDHKHRPPKIVQFPEGFDKPTPLPYPLSTHDSDIMSSRASSIAGTDDDSEDYDWSDEEDLVDEEAKYSKQMGSKPPRRGWGFRRIISLLFSSLIGSTLLSAILVTPALLVHFFWFKPDPSDHRRYVRDNVQAWFFWAASNVLISWYLAMIIDIIPILFRFFISAVWGHVSESIKTKIETYDSVKDTAKPAFYAGSTWASWVIIFVHIYKLYDQNEPEKSRARYTIRLSPVVEFFFFLVLVWCAQGMLSHFIAFSFHRTAYKERIESVEKTLVVIEKLRQYRPKYPASTPNFKSGARTPIFGHLGISPFSDKQHSKALTGALKNVGPHPTRSNTDVDFRDDDAHDGDVEDGDRTLINSPHRKHRKWFGSQSSADEPTPSSKHKLHSTTHRSKGKDKVKVKDETITKDGMEVEIEMSPMSPSKGQVYSATAPTMPSHLNPHRYPPTSDSPRQSLDGGTDRAIRQAAKVVKTALMHDARNLAGKDGTMDGLAWNVNSSHEAKRLAKSIYMRLKNSGRTWLIPSDFYPAFPDHASAEEAFKVFDKDNNGDLSRAELKTAVLKVYRERRFLSRSMRDVGEALATLNRILLILAGIVLFFIALSVFNVNVGESLSSVYTLGIAASFIFKNAASSAFDSIMLLFVTHPYDTGDRVIIGQENLVVKKVGLFATVFTRSDGTETYYFNSQLFNQFILNVRRSGKTFENLTMQVAWTTPLTKLDALEKCLNTWLSTEENRWFEPSTSITLQNIAFQRYLELTIGIGHNGNWQNWGLRNARKTAFHAAVQYYCKQLGIVGYEAPLPIVYANPQTMKYEPPSQNYEEVRSPMADTPLTADELRQEAVEAEVAAKAMKPTLGFLPPLEDRSSRLMARKSRHKKANLGAGNADC
ncbi:Mechanosensitive ion channel protein Msy1 [Psilocybe cubensis]|uniref:Mechanosensitive ion channel protein Msy1 n=2 Tax=Psilocybe cubensis TaxID=181762 RepID=A0ACB8H4E9_PSICU|nr:Mechanosensitive ion channel protein Msy1 [Psilocybe cubensis]KAH9482890.1 Mechanosensitive ion channel protein Msy1 [Psilocybe cubensis]